MLMSFPILKVRIMYMLDLLIIYLKETLYMVVKVRCIHSVESIIWNDQNQSN